MSIMSDAPYTDEGIAILVIRPGGAGYALGAFIDSVFKEIDQSPKLRVGKASDPCTKGLQFATVDLSFLPKQCKVQYRYLFLIDTPCRTKQEREELLWRVREWRQESSSRRTILGGFIYFDDASGALTSPETLEFCKHMCGDDRLNEIIVVQSAPREARNEPDSRLQDLDLLGEGDSDWSSLFDKGLRACSLGNGRSAWGTVSLLLLPYVNLDGILDQRDAYVIVLGFTGVGKSTFINAILGEERMKVGYGLSSRTTDIEVAEIKNSGHQSQRVFLVDTPGLNDSMMEDREILKRIVNWLTAGEDVKNVVGIIYLHDISQERVTKGDTLRFRDLQNVYGEDYFHKVVFGLTKLERISPDLLRRREKELQENHWRSMISKGARVCRFEKDSASAWRIVRMALSKHAENRMLQTQKEMAMGLLLRNADLQDGPARKNAVYIIVMGLTGAGKSTFINAVLGKKQMEVGYGLLSCTKDIAVAEVTDPSLQLNHRVFIVDTPGFDDSSTPVIPDTTILERIAEWLVTGGKDPKHVAGVIYLHDVSSDKFSFSDTRSLRAFQKICGEDSFHKVVIGTTKSNKPGMTPGGLQNRENELKDKYWLPMTKKGTRVCRFDNDTASARGIVRMVLDNYKKDSMLHLQEEIVIDNKPISKTDAYRILSVRSRASQSNGILHFFHRLFGL